MIDRLTARIEIQKDQLAIELRAPDVYPREGIDADVDIDDIEERFVNSWSTRLKHKFPDSPERIAYFTELEPNIARTVRTHAFPLLVWNRPSSAMPA